MGGYNNLSQGDIGDLIRRVRALENRTTLNNAAIGRSGMEVYDGGSINISNGTFYLNGYGSVAGTLAVSGTLPVTGGVIVSGTERITGNWFLDGVGQVAGTMTIAGGLIVDGTQKVAGTLDITGNLTVTGPTKLNGKTDIGGNTTVTGNLGVKGPLEVTGAMDIKGKSTLQNDLTVRSGGRVKVGGVTLDPERFDGGVVFSNSSYLAGTPNGAQLIYPSGGAVTVSPGQADLGVVGGGAVIAHRAGVAINGLPTTSEKPNVYIDSNGQLKRSTA